MRPFLLLVLTQLIATVLSQSLPASPEGLAKRQLALAPSREPRKKPPKKPPIKKPVKAPVDEEQDASNACAKKCYMDITHGAEGGSSNSKEGGGSVGVQLGPVSITLPFSISNPWKPAKKMFVDCYGSCWREFQREPALSPQMENLIQKEVDDMYLDCLKEVKSRSLCIDRAMRGKFKPDEKKIGPVSVDRESTGTGAFLPIAARWRPGLSQATPALKGLSETFGRVMGASRNIPSFF